MQEFYSVPAVYKMVTTQLEMSKRESVKKMCEKHTAQNSHNVRTSIYTFQMLKTHCKHTFTCVLRRKIILYYLFGCMHCWKKMRKNKTIQNLAWYVKNYVLRLFLLLFKRVYSRSMRLPGMLGIYFILLMVSYAMWWDSFFACCAFCSLFPYENAQRRRRKGDNPILYTFSLECDTLHSYSPIYWTGATINAFAYRIVSALV